jgi:MYXO-CTERM domain-containing protein
MSTRSLVLLSFAATAFTFSASALADVPNPSSSSSSGSTTTSGTGGSKYAADCSVAGQSQSGTTCATCTGGACSSLGGDFNFVCNESATVQVWCNGPIRNVPSDQNVAGCSVSVANSPLSGAAAACGLAALAGLFLRRRR